MVTAVKRASADIFARTARMVNIFPHVGNLFSTDDSEVKNENRESAEFEDSLKELTKPLNELNMLTTTAVIEANDFVEGVRRAPMARRIPGRQSDR